MIYKTTLVLVSYNSAHLLKKRLPLFGDRPIVVTDNASRDETRDLLKREFPSVRLIANETNEGYGRAANQAIAEVTTPYALLVNPDVELTPEDVRALEADVLRVSEPWLLIAPETGVAPGSLEAGGSASTGINLAETETREKSLEAVDFASGAALFFNVHSFRALGGFDPNIFLFFEETDLCRRARAAGQGMFYDAELQIAHEIGTSSERTLELDYVRKWHFHWSLLYYSRKHGMWADLLRALWKNLVVARLKFSKARSDPKRFALTHARFDSAKTFLSGGSAFDDAGGPTRNRFLRDLAGR